jgi:hypothetical protein
LAGVAYLAATKLQALIAAMIGLGALFLLAREQSRREERKLRALAFQREGQTICEFARDFEAREVDTWIIRAVYEQLQGQLKHVHPSFPIRADDRLKEDLLLDDDDLDMDLAQEVELRTGISIANPDNNPYFGKVRSVRDFVLFFEHQAKAGDQTHLSSRPPPAAAELKP